MKVIAKRIENGCLLEPYSGVEISGSNVIAIYLFNCLQVFLIEKLGWIIQIRRKIEFYVP